MSLTIGPVTLNGTDAQNEAMRPFVTAATALLSLRLKALTIEVRARALMPRYRDPQPGDKPGDGHAEGYWRKKLRRILIADDVFAPGRTDLEETIGHEFIHALFDDWFRPEQENDLLPFLVPEPENYNDTFINGKDKGYPALPEECIAVWGGAALFGFQQPAYATLYKRVIPRADFAAVKDLMLGLSTPVDPCADLKAQVVALTARMVQIHELSA